ncbi:amidase [Rhizobium sp. TRM96647]|uniref:amidase n=1 Tax=unclassified Rhizobium TaxID=2613769 RepID=UPI0021E8920F|nr:MULTISPECIES: amidase [unclassified Rhizobium]MCV3736855.1 amidase [Rhizobium sp. TRM96647]MCV3756745.1 amidase [Rhizobium sp. TRM96650]
MDGLTALSATELSAEIHGRKVSCRSVMEAYLARIGAINPLLNAIVSLRDEGELIAEAEAADRALAAGGSRGWLHGMPFAVKDLSEARGIRCTYGSRIYRDFIPDHDDIHVERIRAAGAIVIGKTNAPEMGLGSHTYNDVFGVTRNPYDLAKSAGGSSGGAAAALAARLVPVADGSDMMGSLRNPAAFNNVIGFRPSFGRVPSLGNELYLGQHAVNGPMGRSVADVAALLATQAGHDARDPLSLPTEDLAPGRARDFSGARIGWFGDHGGHLPFEPGVLEVCRSALEVLAALGAAVAEVPAGFDMDRLWWGWKTYRHFLVASAQAADHADPDRRAMMKPEMIWEIENGLALSAGEIAAASAIRSDWYRYVLALFERYDFLALPSAQVFPFDVETHWPRSIAGRAMDTYHRWMEVVIGPTMAGLPVAAMPAGFGPEGLPAGIQIIGPPRADRAVLQIAAAYEALADWTGRAPDIG